MSTLTGDHGKLKVGYQTACTLHKWVVTRQQETLGEPTVTLTAAVAAVDGYWSRQQPLTLGLDMGKAWWVWSIVELEEGDSIVVGNTITLRIKGTPVAAHSF